MSNESKARKTDDARGIDSPLQEKTSGSRRNLIKAGLVGVPVILTLKGKPAWANNSVAVSGKSVAPPHMHGEESSDGGSTTQ